MIQKSERTRSVTNLPKWGRPRIIYVQVAEVLYEKYDKARDNASTISSATAISKRTKCRLPGFVKFYAKF